MFYQNAILNKNNVVKNSGVCNSIVMNYERYNSEQQLHSQPEIMSENNVVKNSGICNSIVINYVRCNSEQHIA